MGDRKKWTVLERIYLRLLMDRLNNTTHQLSVGEETDSNSRVSREDICKAPNVVVSQHFSKGSSKPVGYVDLEMIFCLADDGHFLQSSSAESLSVDLYAYDESSKTI